MPTVGHGRNGRDGEFASMGEDRREKGENVHRVGMRGFFKGSFGYLPGKAPCPDGRAKHPGC